MAMAVRRRFLRSRTPFRTEGAQGFIDQGVRFPHFVSHLFTNRKNQQDRLKLEYRDFELQQPSAEVPTRPELPDVTAPPYLVKPLASQANRVTLFRLSRIK